MRHLNERGFTLIESLLHCAILLVVSFIFSLLVVVCLKIPSTEQVLNEVKWEVTSFDTNQLFSKEINDVKVNKDVELEVVSNERKYSIIVSNKQLAKREKGGFEIIHWPITKAIWKLEQNELQMTAVLENGDIKERTFYVRKFQQ